MPHNAFVDYRHAERLPFIRAAAAARCRPHRFRAVYDPFSTVYRLP